MKLLDAQEYLLSLASSSELWVRHSFRVERVADWLCSYLKTKIDKEEVLVCALLHDAGRSVTHGILHPWEGFRLLSRIGEDSAARAALTHWIKGRSLMRAMECSNVLMPKELIRRIFQLLSPPSMTLVDQIVSIADGLVSHDRVVTLEERYQELRDRYSDTPWLRDSERIGKAQLKRLSKEAGVDLFRLVENELIPRERLIDPLPEGLR